MVKENSKTLKKIDFSVVVPIYNEEGNIAQLDREIKEVMDKLGTYEIIYINDGSRDKSILELRELKNVKIINLNRNYGQATALDAGFKESQGEIVISMDGDLQNDPKDIPKLIDKLEMNKLDVVTGWRKNRKDNGGIKLLSRTGRVLRSFLLNDKVHDTGCTLRVYRKEAVKALDLQGEMHRYILALLRWKGFRISELEVNHRPRIHGRTKYGASKAVRGLIDLIYIWFIQKYYQRPLHMFGYLSLFSTIIGILAIVQSIVARAVFGLSVNRNGWFFLGIFFLIIAVLFFTSGIIMDLLIRIHLTNSPFEKRYYIRSVEEK